MLFGMFLMFVLMMAATGALLWLAWRRMGEHLRGNPQAVAELTSALTTHVFVPLMGKKKQPEASQGESHVPQGP
jgi:hypothetical protein